MSDLFDDLDFEMLGGDFEDPFENEPVDPMPPPVPGMPNAGHQPVQHPKAAVQKASEADCTEGPAQHRILAPPHQASAEAFTNAEAQVTKADDNAADTAAYSEAFGMETLYHPTFLEKDEELYRMIQPGDIWLDGKRVPELSILIGCVDNNKSRQMCHRVFERSSHLVYIDSGNDEFSGQVVCGIRCNRRTIYKPVCKLYPDMLEETDKFPSKLSCAEAAVSAPQSITANIMAATVVTDFVYNIVARGKLTTRYAVFSAASINVRAESNKKRQRRTA